MTESSSGGRGGSGVWRTLTELAVPSEPGNERQAMEQVAEAVQGLGLSQRSLDRMKTAVAEATMNAMEHGNQYVADRPVLIKVSVSERELLVSITDQGSGPLNTDAETPDLEKKLESQQTPRGWGLFLIKSMVDEMRLSGDENYHTIELIVHLEEHREGGT